MSSFYTKDGDRFIPTDLVTGPWSDEHCHGGPPSALLTNEIHAVAPEMGISRITFDILHQIPMKPATIRTEVLRGGKRVQLVQGDLIGEDEQLYLRAHAWLIRIDENVSPAIPYNGPLPPPPESCPRFTIQFRDTLDTFDGVELRTAAGTPFGGTPATLWIRPKVPLIEGHDVSPYSVAPFAADFANGIARVAPFEKLTAINTDLTVYFARPPKGSWIAVNASTISQGLGLGMTDSLVYDASGFVGRSNQSIYLDAT